MANTVESTALSEQKKESKPSPLPHYSGDRIFGFFMLAWIATLAWQVVSPMEQLGFERWIAESAPVHPDPLRDTRFPKPTPTWTGQSFWIPMICSFVYFTMLIHGPELMKDRQRPKWLKKVVFIWNVLLSLSSSWAAFRLAGNVYKRLTVMQLDETYDNHFNWIVCMDTTRVKDMGAQCSELGGTCTYLMLFCFSKIPEMLDTLWLILAKKKVIFLHWFHHSSVMWFCWLAWAHAVPMGIVFALMNLTVHSIMYAWYALAAANNWIATGLKPTRLFSQTVTLLQIAQMIAGTSLTVYVWWNHDDGCHNDLTVIRAAFGIYGVYLILFVHFFIRAYCGPLTRPPIMTVRKPQFAKEGPVAPCVKQQSFEEVVKRPAGGKRRGRKKRKSRN